MRVCSSPFHRTCSAGICQQMLKEGAGEQHCACSCLTKVAHELIPSPEKRSRNGAKAFYASVTCSLPVQTSQFPFVPVRPAMAQPCDVQPRGSQPALAHPGWQRAPLSLGPLRSPRGGGLSPGVGAVSCSSVCVLAGISAQLAEAHVAKQRLKCKELWQSVCTPLKSPLSVCSACSPGCSWVSQFRLFLALLADDPGNSGGLAVPCLSLGPLGVYAHLFCFGQPLCQTVETLL